MRNRNEKSRFFVSMVLAVFAVALLVMTTIQPAVPICEKAALTLEEAAAFSNIGINKLWEITNERNCDFVFFVGNKRLI